MRGSLTQRSKGSWSIILDLGYETDPATGRQKRKQRWHTVRGTRKQAEDKLADLLKEVKDGDYLDPSELTVLTWLRHWLAVSVKPHRAANTHLRYHGIVENHIAPASLGRILLQQLRASHLDAYYLTIPAGSATVHHTMLRRALRKAKKDRLVTLNAAADVDEPPRRARGRASEDVRQNCWTAGEAATFLASLDGASGQDGAFYALALDTGMRKGELCGLRWTDVDWDRGGVHVIQQLLDGTPTFGPPKGKRARTITIAAETIERLRTHQRQQRELSMRNRTHYRAYDLVFAKEWAALQRPDDQLGQPLPKTHLGPIFDRLVTAAGVKRITLHGLRHTSATLLLLAHVPVHVVAQRLGHRDVQTTLNTYAHVLPDAQRAAADTLGSVLYGKVR